MTTPSRFVVRRNPVTRQWRFRLQAPNGETVATSESYHNRADCLAAINVVKAIASYAMTEDRS